MTSSKTSYIELPKTNYCLTCRCQHGPLYVCKHYTLSEQLDLELMGIRYRQQVNKMPFVQAFLTFFCQDAFRP